MVVFAVGTGPPHVGVWRAELPNVLNARSISAATGRAGCSKPRPGRDDPIPSRGTWCAVGGFYAAAAAFGIARNSALSAHMRCRITASLRATATLAFLWPMRLARRRPHSFKAEAFWTRDSNVVAASNR
jgi:hypothetical protein